MEIIAVGALCICGVIFSLYLGESNKMIGQLLLMLIAFFIAGLMLNKLFDLLSVIEIIRDISGVNSTYTKMLLKMTGIIVISEFVSDICDQAGQKAIGKQVLLLGRTTILMVGYPILLEFIEMMRRLLT